MWSSDQTDCVELKLLKRWSLQQYPADCVEQTSNEQRERKQLTAWKQTGKSDVPAQKTNPTAELGQGRARGWYYTLVLSNVKIENNNENTMNSSRFQKIKTYTMSLKSRPRNWSETCFFDHAKSAGHWDVQGLVCSWPCGGCNVLGHDGDTRTWVSGEFRAKPSSPYLQDLHERLKDLQNTDWQNSWTHW